MRTGVPSLYRVARSMCRLIYVFEPVIRKVYSGNALLLAALDTAKAACDAFAGELYKVIEFGD